MATVSCIYENLRDKLDTLGYTQPLPIAAVPLVNDLFSDLVKTTQSLRDLKDAHNELVKEKNCWELGVEPYKCDNSRLLQELSSLNAQHLEAVESFEEQLIECKSEIRILQSDNKKLLEHNQEMQKQLRDMCKQSFQTKVSSKGGRKPFISTVRSNEKNLAAFGECSNHDFKCTKCVVSKSSLNGDSRNKSSTTVDSKRLENELKEMRERLDLYSKKVESREREISRLNDLLVGGRPVLALAKDCCYKALVSLNEDITRLQVEKAEYIKMLDEYENKMHEAMQKSIDLSKVNQDLMKELKALSTAALNVENVANDELAKQDKEIQTLQAEVKELTKKCESLQVERAIGGAGPVAGDSNRTITKDLKNEIKELSETVSDQKEEIKRLLSKIEVYKGKVFDLDKQLKDHAQQKAFSLDEEKIRLKSERDFFQKEFLRMVANTGSQKEIEFLQQQIKSKDEELRILRGDLFAIKMNCGDNFKSSYSSKENIGDTANKAGALKLPLSARSTTTSASNIADNVSTSGSGSSLGSLRTSDCIQAAVLRAERERDCVRSELERVRCERDTLREKHLSATQLHAEEMKNFANDKENLRKSLKELEGKLKELKSKNNDTQIVCLKEDIEDYKKQIQQLRKENVDLEARYNQLRTIQEQTQRALKDEQKRLAEMEEKLLLAESKSKGGDYSTETNYVETMKLKEEINSLKDTYIFMEREKDKLLSELDDKTEKAYKLEYELVLCQEQRKLFERQVVGLENKLSNLKSQKRDWDAELHESSSEAHSLRQQITALQVSRDKAIEENNRLSNELAERESEILTIKKNLLESEAEIDRLKKQLRQYVQEVKKAEDLLLEKEKQREEMLEHYRNLSIDAVALEGNNQSLEAESTENKRIIKELESEIEALKKDLESKNAKIRQLEDKVSLMDGEINSLTAQLEEAKEEKLILRVDLQARQELCDKLDVEKEKLNAEINEFTDIRKKLEQENEILRTELEQVDNDYKASSIALEDVLKETRKDLEEQLKIDNKLNKELLRLKEEKESLLCKLNAEQEKRRYEEVLVKEMHVQNQELRQNITDDRFRRARSREASPKFNTS